MKNILQSFLFILIFAMVLILPGCELGVETDESALVKRFEAVELSLDVLESKVDANHAEFLVALDVVMDALWEMNSEIDELNATDQQIKRRLRHTRKAVRLLFTRLNAVTNRVSDLESEVEDLWESTEKNWETIIKLIGNDWTLYTLIQDLRADLDAHKVDYVYFAHPWY